MKLRVPGFLTLSCAAVLLMLASCSRKSDSIIDTIPASASLVAHVDADAFFKASGAQLRDGAFVLSPAFSKLVESNSSSESTGPSADLVSFLADNAASLDLSHLFFFSGEGAAPVATLPLVNSDALKAYLDKRAQPDASFSPSQGLKKAYLYGAACILISDSQVWISRSADNVVSALAEASESHYGLLTTRRQLLEEAADITVISAAANQSFCHTAVNFKPNAIAASVDAYDSEGNNITSEDKISVLSTDFLRYSPADAQFAFAFGQITAWPEIEKAISEAGSLLDAQQRMALGLILPYLKDIDGTTSIVIAPAAGAQALRSPSPTAWDFTVMTHFPQARTDELLSMISSYASMAGLSLSSDSDGNSCYIIRDLPDLHLYVGDVDGYLALSSRPLSGTSNSSFTTDFLSKRAAFVIDIPYGSETMKAFELPWGFSLVANAETNTANITFRLNGSSSNPLEALIDFAASKR